MTLTNVERWLRPRLLGRSAEEPKALELTLGTDSTWSARVRRPGLEVRCLEGMLLVTLEGDVEDHVLTAGMALVAGRRGRLAVWALENARVRVQEAEARPSAEATGPRSAVAASCR